MALTAFSTVPAETEEISYLRTRGLRVGLLMNFNSMLLKEGLKRIVV